MSFDPALLLCQVKKRIATLRASDQFDPNDLIQAEKEESQLLHMTDLLSQIKTLNKRFENAHLLWQDDHEERGRFLHLTNGRFFVNEVYPSWSDDQGVEVQLFAYASDEGISLCLPAIPGDDGNVLEIFTPGDVQIILKHIAENLRQYTRMNTAVLLRLYQEQLLPDLRGQKDV